ncbi:MAG: hypothetical protein ACREBG_20690 [Pyrinomonadaceae bacterium]
MAKRILAIVLSGILLSLSVGFQTVSAQSAQDDQLAPKARADISKLGVGKNARVEVKLRDNAKLKGYISDTGQDSFTLTDSKTGAQQMVAYSDVTRVKKAGGGISKRTWVTLAGVAAGAVITWIVVKPVLCDGGAQTRDPC